ncbi:hypothetical protein BGZ60DRAFT_531038 [Tricladium varicosporioides]|nr:hypothetical protein BGZ60DRAFT_531038 [Hymenoscyphus varicosporioides]
MSLLQAYRNLSPKTRIAVGLSVIAWGTIGLYVSDNAEKKLGFEATAKDKEALKEYVPRVTIVDREETGKS